MKKNKCLFFSVIMCVTFHSCIKSELPNMECDIIKAVVHVQNPQDIFYHVSDTLAHINSDYGTSIIQFQNVRKNASHQLLLAPEFKLSDGAVLFPPSGMTRDYSNDSTQVYFVIAEDTKDKYSLPVDLTELKTSDSNLAQKLIAGASSGEHIRPYYIQFKTINTVQIDTIKYDFEHYYLETQAKQYYEWSDPYEDGSLRTVSNWATANKGFGTARSTAKPEEYPTAPAIGEGVNKSAGVKLETVNTGTFGKLFNMPLAAGNLFLGTFDMSVALTKTLQATHFGENCILEKKPIKFSGYYHYAPGQQMTNSKGVNIDGTDTPAIYCVVYKNHDSDGNLFILNGENVDTDSEHVVAKAEVKEWIYNSEGYVYFELPFTWTKEFSETILNQKGYNYAIVCSSSKDGATYTGALGSKLYVDDFSLVMQKDE